MKMFPAKILILALALAGGFSAAAQSSGVPGDTDYTAFSRFIAARNIFDPNRYPHETRSYTHRYTHVSPSAPEFTLAGTISYGKGWFAFFNGNSYDLKQVLPVSGAIAGYTVTGISLGGATIQGPDKKVLALKIGDQMQHGNNGWELVTNGLAAAGSGVGGGSSGSSSGSSGPDASATDGSAAPAPSSSLSGNDILKRLMQLRQQENK